MISLLILHVFGYFFTKFQYHQNSYRLYGDCSVQALWVDGLGAGPGLWAAPKHLGPPEALVPGPVPWPGLGPAYTLKHETSMERHETSAKRHETSIENLILALLLRIAHFGGGLQINMALETRVFRAPRYRVMFTGSDVKQHAMRQAGQNRK